MWRLQPRSLTTLLRPISFPSAAPSRLTRLISYRPGRVLDLEHQLMEQEDQDEQRARQREQKERDKQVRGITKKGRKGESAATRTSKTLSYILRHGAMEHGLRTRPDGYVRVADLLRLQVFQGLTMHELEQIVADDAKGRYHMVYEPDEDVHEAPSVWWIRANQGHTMKVEVELRIINSVEDIPTKIAVHGTTRKAWESIRSEGLNKMKRNHVHLAQGVSGANVISGMRNSSQILIYINVQKALDAGIRFYMSSNGVVLTEGDKDGYLRPEFFERVVTRDGQPVADWEPSTTPASELASESALMANQILEPQTAPAASDSVAANSVDDLQKTTDKLSL